MIIFRKPLYIRKEGDEGSIINAVVIFGKRPEIMHTEFVGGQVVNFPIQFRYQLKIDLWLVVLYWCWLGKEVDIKQNDETTN